RGGQADQPDRSVQAGRRCAEGQRSEGRAAQQQADRRRGLGRQGPEEIRRRLQRQDVRLIPSQENTMVSAVFHSPMEAAAEAQASVPVRPPMKAGVPVATKAAANDEEAKASKSPVDWGGIALRVFAP